jgi:hypothetical protein
MDCPQHFCGIIFGDYNFYSYFCNQVSPMRRKRRQLGLILWVQGGGAILVGKTITT